MRFNVKIAIPSSDKPSDADYRRKVVSALESDTVKNDIENALDLVQGSVVEASFDSEEDM